MLKQKTYGKIFLPLITLFLSLLFLIVVKWLNNNYFIWISIIAFTICSYFLGNYHDNTIIKSTKDFLTKTYNRLFAHDYLHLLFEQNQRDNTPFTIILIDLDNFKYINDNFGHSVGDQVLIYISDILKQSTRKMDCVCRLGGDEFLIICPNTNHEQAKNITKRIKDNIKKSKINDRKKHRDYYKKASYYFRGISFGLAEFEKEHKSIKTLLDKADTEMYNYKKINKEIKSKVDKEIEISRSIFKKEKSS